MSKLKILVTNDDGYFSAGINALAKALSTVAHVEVIAPEQDSSGMSSCLTIKRPLEIIEVRDGIRFVTGTPADSVYLAINGVLNYRPDLIVSGINNGANLGNSAIYSGTVAAGVMGNMLGIPALAFSLVQKGWEHLDVAAQVACELVQELADKKSINGFGIQPSPWLLNVNVPNVPYAELKGREITRLGKRSIGDATVRTQNPYGNEVHWLGLMGELSDFGEGTDYYATAHHKVSITPLRTDLTCEKTLDKWNALL